jgi:hypothetical protein
MKKSSRLTLSFLGLLLVCSTMSCRTGSAEKEFSDFELRLKFQAYQDSRMQLDMPGFRFRDEVRLVH